MDVFLLLASMHFGEGRKEYETFTPGVLVGITEHVAVSLYRNSVANRSVGIYYDTRWPSYRSRVVLGAASGYPGVDYGEQIQRPWDGADYHGILPYLGFAHEREFLGRTVLITYTVPTVVSVGVRF